MSLQHVFRAEKLACLDGEDPKLLEALRSGGDLKDLRSEAGCNMLLVYLLKRWSRIYSNSRGIAASEDFQNQVVDAYVSVGCAIDAPAEMMDKIHSHTSPEFRRDFRFPNRQITPLGFVQVLLKELHPEMYPEPYQQLQRLEERLGGYLDGEMPEASICDQGLSEPYAFLVRGSRQVAEVASPMLEMLRETSEHLKLQVFVAADEGNLPPGAEVDVVVGLSVAVACADDGDSTSLDEQSLPEFTATQSRYLGSLDEVTTYLVASGPLSTAYLVRGVAGAAGDDKDGEFVAGVDTNGNPHDFGVWGEVIASTSDLRNCPSLDDFSQVFLFSRYD